MKLQPRIVHALPGAPVFVGRATELEKLQRFWGEPSERVVSLIGLGGAGKTALAKRFVEWLMGSGQAVPEPAGVFVWSFYVDQDVGKFLQEAYAYFTGEGLAGVADMAMLHRLDAALGALPQSLLVLDGLERIQREMRGRGGMSGMRHIFGELEDPLMKQFVVQLAHGFGRSKCMITSRFPLTDLSAWEDGRYVPIGLDQLPAEDARTLLRRRGVVGSDAAVERLLEEFGTHALTIDRLGTFLTTFCGGDPEWAAFMPEPEAGSNSAEERKLARVLQAYQSKLNSLEAALLSRICLFRFGIKVEALHQLIANPKASEAVVGALRGMGRLDLERLAQRLIDIQLIQREPDGALTAHAAIRDHFYRLFTEAPELHKAATALFSSEAGEDVEEAFRRMRHQWREIEYGHGMAESKGGAVSPTIRLLIKNLAKQVEKFIERYGERLQEQLRNDFLEFRELLLRGDLDEVHKFTAATSDLFRRPGVNCYPKDKHALDLLEELIYHTLQGGDVAGAMHLYQNHLGGRQHLAKQIGQYARGVRILRYFHPCPNMLDLAWYLRGAGELQAALETMNDARPIWSGPILCLMGRLTHVNGRHWEQSRQIADLLMGREAKPLPVKLPAKRQHIPYLGWGEAMVDSEFLLLSGHREGARRLAEVEIDRERTPWNTNVPEAIRSRFVLAALKQEDGRAEEAQKDMAFAEKWTVASGSVEHMLVMHLTRARMRNVVKEHVEALNACERGLQLARSCGFSIAHADLALEAAETYVALGNAGKARECLQAARCGVTRGGRVPEDAMQGLEEMQVLGYAHPACRYELARRRAERIARMVS